MRHLRLLIALTMLLTVAPDARGQDPSASSEYLIKAGFIYNFANLVQWPQTAFAQPDSPIVIGILGEDPFGAVIDHALEGKKVNGRGFVIKRLKSASDLNECHILYVSSADITNPGEILHSLKGLPILTIGEMPGFAKRGGIINLVLDNERVRFEVNIDAAKQADLNISSRLLALATIIQPAADGRMR